MPNTPSFKPAVPHDLLPTDAGYDRWSEIYDAENNPLILLEQPRVRALLEHARGLDVVDLGCGTGRHTLWLAGRGARVTAVDFSDGMVARARAKPGWEGVHFIRHDLTRPPLPLPDASFDRVLSALVLDHIGDLLALLRECRRICRPHGSIILSTVHPAMMLRGIRAHFTDPATGRDVCPASVANQLSDYVLAALRAGLRIEQMEEHAIGPAEAALSERAAKYLDWPMLLLMVLRP